MSVETDDRIKTAYDTFRHGIQSKDIPLPWGHLLPWMKDAMRVAYLQGTLDGRAGYIRDPRLDPGRHPDPVVDAAERAALGLP